MCLKRNKENQGGISDANMANNFLTVRASPRYQDKYVPIKSQPTLKAHDSDPVWVSRPGSPTAFAQANMKAFNKAAGMEKARRRALPSQKAKSTWKEGIVTAVKQQCENRKNTEQNVSVSARQRSTSGMRSTDANGQLSLTCLGTRQRGDLSINHRVF